MGLLKPIKTILKLIQIFKKLLFLILFYNCKQLVLLLIMIKEQA